MSQNHAYNFDSELELKDAGLVAADAAAQVDGAAKVVDLGAAKYVKGTLVVDVTAIEIASNDEKYDIHFQLSDSATFADTIETKAILRLGALEILCASVNDVDSAVGRHTLHVDNEVNGTIYRYCRLYTEVNGTIATGINYSAFLAPE